MPRKTRSAPPLAGVLVLDTGAANVHISCSEGHKDDVCTMPNAIARTRQGVRRQILVGDCIETECQDYGELQLRFTDGPRHGRRLGSTKISVGPGTRQDIGVRKRHVWRIAWSIGNHD